MVGYRMQKHHTESRAVDIPDIFQLPLAITARYEHRRRFGTLDHPWCETVRDLVIRPSDFNWVDLDHLHTHDASRDDLIYFHKISTIGSALKRACTRVWSWDTRLHPSPEFALAVTQSHT